MNDKTWDNLKNSIRLYVTQNRPSSISIAWFGGEPLLELNKIKLFYAWFDKLCTENNIQYSSEVTTNGYLINGEMIAFFKRYQINSFQITVDGMPDTHDRLRYLNDGRGTWQKVIDNLLLMKTSFVEDLNVTIRVNYSIDTIQSVIRFLDFVSENFDDRFSISLNAISKLGGENDSKLTHMSTEVISYTDLQLIKLLNSKKVDAGAMFSIFNPFGMICYASKANSLVINPQGKILKCTVELENDANIVGNIDNGYFYLDDKKFSKWTSVDCGILEDRKCIKCKFLPLCMSRCCGFSNTMGIKKCPIQITLIDSYLEQYYEYLKN